MYYITLEEKKNTHVCGKWKMVGKSDEKRGFQYHEDWRERERKKDLSDAVAVLGAEKETEIDLMQ